MLCMFQLFQYNPKIFFGLKWCIKIDLKSTVFYFYFWWGLTQALWLLDPWAGPTQLHMMSHTSIWILELRCLGVRRLNLCSGVVGLRLAWRWHRWTRRWLSTIRSKSKWRTKIILPLIRIRVPLVPVTSRRSLSWCRH